MGKDGFKIENLHGEIYYELLNKPCFRFRYIQFAVHYMSSDGIRMQHFTEHISYSDGTPKINRKESFMLNNNKRRIEYLARNSEYTTLELYHAIADRLDCILCGTDNTIVNNNQEVKNVNR